MKSSNDTVYMMSESFLFCHVAGEGLSVELQWIDEGYWEVVTATVVVWIARRNTAEAWQWWHTPLIPALGR